MFNKGNYMKIIDIGYWTIIIGMALSLSIEDIVEQINLANITTLNLDTIINTIAPIFGFFTLMVTISMFMLFYLTIPYIGVKIANVVYKKRRLDKIDFKNDKYYRDLVPKYSIGVLSYIDSFDVSDKDVVATLLSLELKKKITIDDKIIIINEQDYDLAGNEKYVFSYIKSGKLKDLDMYKFEDEIRRDCIQNGLLQTSKTAKHNKVKSAIISCISYVGIILLFKGLQILANTVNIEGSLFTFVFAIISLLVFLALVIYPFVIGISMIVYFVMKAINPYVRTKQGKKINTKLEGLKKFIGEFSNIEDKEKEALVLWEYYLIYSVMFGINTKVVEQVKSKII